MLSKAKYKTRLTQNIKAKHKSNATKKKKKQEEREEVIESLRAFSFHTLEEPFL